MSLQATTTYRVVVNLDAAWALGLDISPSVLAQADEIVE